MHIPVKKHIESMVGGPGTGGIANMSDTAEHRDYLLFLRQINFTQHDIEQVMENAGTVVPLPEQYEYLSVLHSQIHGDGIFTSLPIADGTLICPVVDGKGRTIAARFTNHSPTPNAKFVQNGEDSLLLYAISDIAQGNEILIDYRQACSVNGSNVLPPYLQKKYSGVTPFMSGDAFGDSKRAESLQDSNAQLELMPAGSVREQLYALQKAIGDLPDVEMPLQHTFAPGVYVRTIFIPAGTVLVGKIHKHQHANILSQGHVTVLTESGGTEDLRGPLTLVSEPGTKRAVYAHTDTVWTTIHPTDKTDLDEIEEETISPTYADYEQFIKLQLRKKS